MHLGSHRGRTPTAKSGYEFADTRLNRGETRVFVLPSKCEDKRKAPGYIGSCGGGRSENARNSPNFQRGHHHQPSFGAGWSGKPARETCSIRHRPTCLEKSHVFFSQCARALAFILSRTIFLPLPTRSTLFLFRAAVVSLSFPRVSFPWRAPQR